MSEDKLTDSVSPPPETLSGSPGSILRRCREYHGITLEEASESTKIGISHLKALEEDQIREFANRAYLKGFLRIYATYLGLNSDDVSRMYDKLFGVQVEKPISAGTSTTPTASSRRLGLLKKLMFPALLLVVILITATFFKSGPPPLVRQAQLPAVAPSPLQNSSVQTVQSSARVGKTERVIPPPIAIKPVTEPLVTEKTAPPKRQADTVKGFVIKLKVTQNGTLSSTVDDSMPQQHDLTIGDIIEWKAEKRVTLELSNAGGVDVELNGKPYKPLGPLGKPGYVELDADGIRQ
jgi:cytoskeletal protein RodZ